MPNSLSKGGVVNGYRVNESAEMSLPSFNLFPGLDNLMLSLVSNWNVDSIVLYLPIVEIAVINSSNHFHDSKLGLVSSFSRVDDQWIPYSENIVVSTPVRAVSTKSCVVAPPCLL